MQHSGCLAKDRNVTQGTEAIDVAVLHSTDDRLLGTGLD